MLFRSVRVRERAYFYVCVYACVRRCTRAFKTFPNCLRRKYTDPFEIPAYTRLYIYILYSLAKERKTEIHARVVRTVSNCSRGTDEMSSKRARGNSHAPVPVTLSGGRRILAYFENLPLIDRKRTYYNVLQSGFVLNGRIENVIITVVHTVGRNV